MGGGGGWGWRGKRGRATAVARDLNLNALLATILREFDCGLDKNSAEVGVHVKAGAQTMPLTFGCEDAAGDL